MQLGSSKANATLTDIKFKYDINSFEHLSGRSLNLNEIAQVQINLDTAIPFEPYSDCPSLGSFVLIDRYSNATIAAGMIRFGLRRATNVHQQALTVDRAAREKLAVHKGQVVWLTGLSGAGKSTIANAAESLLHRQGYRTYILDGDNIRLGLSKDLGFSDADRIENIRRIAEVAKLMMDAGMVVITAFISPFRAERDMARSLIGSDDFMEVFVDTPLDVAESRDPKGLYQKARRGALPNFTGIDSDYQAPTAPDLTLDAASLTVDQCAQTLAQAISSESSN
jgi:bifunctional enzyme CysN/CysC